MKRISTHTPLTGCNQDKQRFVRLSEHFYSHTPHGVQRTWDCLLVFSYQISTHTPLTGCNELYQSSYNFCLYFYSHTPHGVQRSTKFVPIFRGRFLLTHPSRGATDCCYTKDYDFRISTHTPLTGCNSDEQQHERYYRISTHTPLTGCNG